MDLHLNDCSSVHFVHCSMKGEKMSAEEKDELKKANDTVSSLMLEFNTIKQQSDFLVENLKLQRLKKRLSP